MPSRRLRAWQTAIVVLFAVLLVVILSGRDEENGAPIERALGGGTTRFDATTNAFGLSASNLEGSQRRAFEQGDSFFTQNWVVAPASTEARDGLGPTFNAQSCASCHVLDGRGSTPEHVDDTATRGLLVRLSIPGMNANGAPLPEPVYGDQLQDRGIAGVPAEGRVVVEYGDVKGSYDDGTSYTLRKPSYRFTDLAFGPMRPDTLTSPRLAPQMIGMGLLEAIPEGTIIGAADPDDRDRDGISGRANYVWNAETQARQLGRFGWKANQASVRTQAAGAFHGDMGITSPVAPTQECTEAQAACRQAPEGGHPELDEQRLATVTFYSRTLAVPAMRDTKAGDVKRGAKEFVAMGCATCHTPTLQTGDHEVAALARQTIHPYTDLLLHDMGPDLADGRPDFEASGQEWRTPPLWGLGLADDVNGYRFLMHDGRARSFEEAILWHGGEAAAARERFRGASAAERAALIRYLESL